MSSTDTHAPTANTHWVSVGEAAQVLGVSHTSIRNWVEDGTLVGFTELVRDRRRWHVDLASVELLQQRRRGSGARTASPVSPPPSGELGSTALAAARRHEAGGRLQTAVTAFLEIGDLEAERSAIRREVDDLRRQAEAKVAQLSAIEDQVQRIYRNAMAQLMSPDSAAELDA